MLHIALSESALAARAEDMERPMRMDDREVEKALALAFLRTGHPGLALATVIIKSGFRVLARTALVVGCVALAPGGGPTTGLSALPGIHH
jgi:hypothetical protein